MKNLINVFRYFYLFELSIVLSIIDFFKWFFLGFFVSFFSVFKYFLKGIIYIVVFVPKFIAIFVLSIFKKGRNKDKVSKIILILTLLVYFICIYLISRWIVQNNRLDKTIKDITDSTEIIEQEPDEMPTPDEPINVAEEEAEKSIYESYPNIPFLSVSFNDLLKQNSNTVGWIKVEGTSVNYPFVQYKDNDYYLKHDFNNKSNRGGWIFGDYRNNMNNLRKNTIIYGHNLLNNTMFGTLPDVLNKKWYNNKNNHFIKISTPDKNMIWQVFSTYTVDPEVYYLKTVFSDEEYLDFIATTKKRSIYNYDVSLTSVDKILTLSTCTNNGKKRVVIHAKLVSLDKR